MRLSSMPEERSREPICREDLEKLASLAERERQGLLRKPHLEAFADRVLCVALCQGAAKHYVDGTNGVKDFDVWTFFAAIDGVRGPHNRQCRKRDFGLSKFGRWPHDPPKFVGRRIDLLWRTLLWPVDGDPVQAVRHYLRGGKPGSTPWHLAQKAVVLLRPTERMGEVAWPYDEAGH